MKAREGRKADHGMAGSVIATHRRLNDAANPQRLHNVRPVYDNVRLCALTTDDEELVERASAGMMTPLSPVPEPSSAASMKMFEPERNLWALVALDGISAATIVLPRSASMTVRAATYEAQEWIFARTLHAEPPAFDWICEAVMLLDVELVRAAISKAIAEKRWLRLDRERRRTVTYTSQIGAASWTWHEARAAVASATQKIVGRRAA